jgi:nucleotide-binding universal stress UspA family protein
MAEKLNTIVVGVDGSDHAGEALEAAADIAEAFSSAVHVVMATHHASSADWRATLDQLPQEFWENVDLHADAHGVLADAERTLGRRGVKCETHLVEDRPADALIGVAEREGADLIVVGTHGYGAGKRMFLGSVSTKMAHHAPCAVLIAGRR